MFHWDPSRPPYPGLLAFQEQDAAIFFGRDDEIRGGLDRLNSLRSLGGARLVLFLGASGSGKSSLVRAGPLPRLRREQLAAAAAFSTAGKTARRAGAGAGRLPELRSGARLAGDPERAAPRRRRRAAGWGGSERPRARPPDRGGAARGDRAADRRSDRGAARLWSQR
jgi:hypothetical protein